MIRVGQIAKDYLEGGAIPRRLAEGRARYGIGCGTIPADGDLSLYIASLPRTSPGRDFPRGAPYPDTRQSR